MRKYILLLLIFISYFGLSQTSPTYENITIRNQATIRQKAYFIPTISAPAVPLEGMLYADTDGYLYYYNGSAWVTAISQWTLTGSDISNNNAGKVTIDSLHLYPLPDEADKVGRIPVIQTNGLVEWASPQTVVDSVQKLMTTASLKGSGKNLEFWKADFSSAQMENGTNANVMVIGDSYATMYGGWIKFMGGSEYGYGGGFEIFGDESWVTSQSTRYVSIGAGWSVGYDVTDTKNCFERYAESSTPGAAIAISSVNFNKFMLNYRQAVGDGTFSVQVGSLGSATNVSANGAALSKWYTQNYGKTTYAMPSDTIFIKNVSGTTRLYGFNIQYLPYVETYSSAVKKGYVETHIVANGGSAIYEMYRGKDTAQLHTLVDSLQLSLAIITFLDTSSLKPVQCMDTLVQVLQAMRPEMDILIVNPIDQVSHLGAYTEKGYDSIASLRGTAYWNSYNTVGTYSKMIATGAQPDGIHLNFSYYGLLWKELNDLLFYPIRQTHRVEAYELRNRGDYLLFQGTQNLAMVSRNPGRMASTAGNTLIGYRDILFPAPSGTHLTYMGYRSGNSTTAGGDNTGVGYNSLYANTIGVHNVAIGQGAMSSNVDGGYNVTIGSNALFYPTNRSNIVAIGYQALGNAVVAANDLTAIGYLSQRNGTSGTNNTSVGRETLTTNSTGGSNTAVGNGAGKMLTNSYNSLFGTYSGFNISTGDYNTSVGALSMQGGGAITGTLNACFGYGTGYSFNGAANNNTLIGANAGLLITTGDANVCLGESAGAQLTTQSNQLYIDNSNTTTPLIYGDLSTNRIKVNGSFSSGVGTVADNDATPDVSGANTFVYAGSANSIAPTDLDNPTPGEYYTFFGNSDTYTLNFPGSTNFKMAGAGKNLGQYDNITFYCQADNLYIMVGYNDITP